MSRIRVIPENLRYTGTSLRVKSENLYTLATQMRNSVNGMDWETRRKVNIEGQINAACSQARGLAAQMQELSRYLQTKAQAFEEADRQGAEGLHLLDGSIMQLIGGTPFSLGAILGWGKNLWPFLPISFLPLMHLSFFNKPLNHRDFTKYYKYKNLAENVPVGIGDDGLYPRNGFKNVNGKEPVSNCTWYAAAAVKKASGGKIDLNDATSDWRHYPAIEGGYGLGSGGDWAWRARNYAKINPDGLIAGVDQSPKSGDVMALSNLGHVAFVEEVKISEDGKTMEVTISEENAIGGGPISSNSSSPISVSGDDQNVVKRWRRTITYNVDPDSTSLKILAQGVEFIHFKYDKSMQN